jgi:hypothetical protein
MTVGELGMTGLTAAIEAAAPEAHNDVWTAVVAQVKDKKISIIFFVYHGPGRCRDLKITWVAFSFLHFVKKKIVTSYHGHVAKTTSGASPF